MSLIHPDSLECTKSELDLFYIPPTQYSLLSGRWVEYQPISPLQTAQISELKNVGSNPIEFQFSGDNCYIDMSKTYIFLQAQILCDDGSRLKENMICAPINLFMHSLFSQIDIELNGTLVTQSQNTYPYRSMIETLLSYGQDSKKSHLTSSLFYKDDAGCFDSKELNGENSNTGFISRHEIIKGSKVFDMYGRLHGDLFAQERFLTGDIKVKIRLTRSKDSFCLIGDGNANYVTNITNATLYVRKVNINPDIITAHKRMLDKTPLKYPVKKIETKSFVVSSNVMDSEFTITNRIPNLLVVGFVDGVAFNGSYSTNPFKFEHFNLSNIDLKLEGHSVPHSGVNLDFKNNLYIRSFYSLFNGIDKTIFDHGNDIDRSDYGNGYTLFVYDLTPDMCNGSHFNVIKQGSLNIKLTFKEALAKPINCICYMDYDSIIMIDKFNQIKIIP
jgi:hypothetical protein